MKTCRKCGVEKSVDEFAKDKSRVDGRNSACRACKADQWHRKGRAYHRMSRYGVTPAQVEALERAQGGVCAICRDRPKGRVLFIDHNHTTGAVRGLLCDHCNRLLGYARESRLILHASAEYLTRYEGK